jgi:hypothetical protein
VDSLLAIIGPAGTDISGIISKQMQNEESESVSEAKPDTTTT